MAEKSVVNLTMVRDFEVEPERVFEAWTNPELFKNWFMTLQATNKVAKNDLQVGGDWESLTTDKAKISEPLELIKK